ncbi:MAG: DUF2207 domain-containing protein [Rhodobacteraceae bacterium]|nr:DUF2207 domain-containing protein [Paracoccaceae bacterium]
MSWPASSALATPSISRSSIPPTARCPRSRSRRCCAACWSWSCWPPCPARRRQTRRSCALRWPRRAGRRRAAGHRNDPRRGRGQRHPPRHLSRLPGAQARARRHGVGCHSRHSGRLSQRRAGNRTVERNGATARLRIGRADRLLPVPSEQVYELTYRTEGQLRSQPEFDELFWNVTGMDWNFPIRAASVDILLPEGVPILRLGGLYRARARRAPTMR